MLTLNDGRILRAEAPALPSGDTLFNDPYNEGYPLKLMNTVIIKGYDVTGLIAIFNIDRWDREIKYRISPGEIPGLEEGRYLAYEWRSGKMQILEYNGEIEGSILFSASSLQLKVSIFTQTIKGKIIRLNSKRMKHGLPEPKD